MLDQLKVTLAVMPGYEPEGFHAWIDPRRSGRRCAQRLPFDIEEVEQRYRQAREYVDLAGCSIPLLFVRGNHEEVDGWDYDGTPQNTAIWSGQGAPEVAGAAACRTPSTPETQTRFRTWVCRATTGPAASATCASARWTRTSTRRTARTTVTGSRAARWTRGTGRSATRSTSGCTDAISWRIRLLQYPRDPPPDVIVRGRGAVLRARRNRDREVVRRGPGLVRVGRRGRQRSEHPRGEAPELGPRSDPRHARTARQPARDQGARSLPRTPGA